MKVICCFLTFIFTLQINENKAVHRIIGGEDTFAGEYPCVAAINVQTNNSKFFCGGAIVNHEWIVTSGHCVNNAVLFTIHVGSHTLEGEDSNRVTLATSTYVVHPEFNPETMENDIGLIKLRMPITYTSHIQPTRFSGFAIHPRDRVRSVGWGQTSDSDPQLSNTLKLAETAALSNEECKSYYGNQITDNMVCVEGNYNEGTCTGDTGSPLMDPFRWPYINGVASFISGNGCESTDPSGYTRILPYVEWIQNVTAS